LQFHDNYDINLETKHPKDLLSCYIIIIILGTAFLSLLMGNEFKF